MNLTSLLKFLSLVVQTNLRCLLTYCFEVNYIKLCFIKSHCNSIFK